jgi:hypothetical protein
MNVGNRESLGGRGGANHGDAENLVDDLDLHALVSSCIGSYYDLTR